MSRGTGVRSMLVAAVAFAALVLVGGASSEVPRALAAGPLLFPAAAGSTWQVASGYNTATHSVADKNDPYALDLVRTDAPSDGTTVLAPVDGTVRFADASCLSITDAQSTTVLLCHLFPIAGLRGKTVVRGQSLGVVAPPGQANNNGLAHIHMALSIANNQPLPFAGAYVLDGVSLPATADVNAYAGTTFTSTNTPMLSVDAGPDLQVRPGTAVTLTALASSPSGVTFAWKHMSGPSVSIANSGASAVFTAPATNNATLVFQVVAVNAIAQTANDTVSVRTNTSAPALGSGAFVAPPVFSTGGLALAVYGGGTVDQLEAAVRSAGGSGVWIQDGSGAYQLLVVGGPAFINAPVRTAFANGFTTPTAVTLTR